MTPDQARELGCQRAAATYAERWQARLDDLRLLLAAGESTEAICARLEVSPRTLYRQLLRRGRNDLAARLELWRWNYDRRPGVHGLPAITRERRPT